MALLKTSRTAASVNLVLQCFDFYSVMWFPVRAVYIHGIRG